jgi:hypothetical protein
MLQGAIIWTPMLLADNLDAAKGKETEFSDPRITHYWDPDHILGRLLSRTLNLQASMAWDVYLIYPPDHPWDEELPPRPEFWMHQLNEEPTLFLDPHRLKHNVQAIIGESI